MHEGRPGPNGRVVKGVVVGNNLQHLAPRHKHALVEAVRLALITLRHKLLNLAGLEQAAQVLGRAIGAAAIGHHDFLVGPACGHQPPQHLLQVRQLVVGGHQVRNAVIEHKLRSEK